MFCSSAGSHNAAGLNHVQHELWLWLRRGAALLLPALRWRGGLLPSSSQPAAAGPQRGHLEEVRAAANASSVAQPHAASVWHPNVRRRTPGGGVRAAGRGLQPLRRLPAVLHHPGLHVEQQLRRRHQAGEGCIREAGVAASPPGLLHQQQQQQHRWSAGEHWVPAGLSHSGDWLHRPLRGVSVHEPRCSSSDGGGIGSVSRLAAAQQQRQWIRWEAGFCL